MLLVPSWSYERRGLFAKQRLYTQNRLPTFIVLLYVVTQSFGKTFLVTLTRFGKFIWEKVTILNLAVLANEARVVSVKSTNEIEVVASFSSNGFSVCSRQIKRFTVYGFTVRQNTKATDNKGVV